MTTTGSTAQSMDTTIDRSQVHARTQPQVTVRRSYESSVLTSMEYIQAVIDYAESSGEQDRRAKVQRRVDIINDAWGPLLKAMMENWVTPEVASAVMGANKDHLDLSRNPAKHIWEELSVLYRLPPTRSTPARKTDIKSFNKLVANTGYEMFWQRVELLLNACNEVLIWPEVITVDGEKIIKHRAAAGNVLTIVGSDDDPTIIDAVLIHQHYQTLDGTAVKRYILWTDKWHLAVEADSEGKLSPVGRIEYGSEDAESDANPFKRFHFHLIRLTDRDDSIWDTTTGEDLVDLTLHLGVERLFYRYLQKMSGFKQGVLTGDAENNVPQYLLDPGHLIKLLGHDLAFQLIDWSVDLKARLECMQMDELAAAAARGINPERYRRTGGYQNASAAARAERGLAERRVRIAPRFQTAEPVYARNLVMVASAVGGFKDLPPEDMELEAQHAPMAYPEDPREQAELDKTRIALALDSPVTIAKREHPTWTDEQCLSYIETNLEHIAKVNDMKTRHMVPDNPENRSDADEQAGRMGPEVRDNRTPMQPPPGTAAGKPSGDRE